MRAEAGVRNPRAGRTRGPRPLRPGWSANAGLPVPPLLYRGLPALAPRARPLTPVQGARHRPGSLAQHHGRGMLRSGSRREPPQPLLLLPQPDYAGVGDRSSTTGRYRTTSDTGHDRDQVRLRHAATGRGARQAVHASDGRTRHAPGRGGTCSGNREIIADACSTAPASEGVTWGGWGSGAPAIAASSRTSSVSVGA